MDIVKFFLHLDEQVQHLLHIFGPWTYVILFAVIFTETGLVIMPFLPGDSLLFIVGTLAGSGFLNIFVAYVVMLAAAIIGDTVNYWIGHRLGEKVFSQENSRFFKKAHLEKTREFYEKHGGKTIILARFVPIVRTFAPFVAGVGKMHYETFLTFNLVGGFLWVTALTFAGYFFGGLPFIKNNFESAVIGIVLISLVPMILEFIKAKQESRVSKKQLEHATYKDVRKTLKKEDLAD